MAKANLEHAEAEIDARLADLYESVGDVNDPDEILRPVARAAWALGVRDVLTEPETAKDILRRNGYVVYGDDEG